MSIMNWRRSNSEVDNLVGDPSKVNSVLEWKARTHVPELARLMVDADDVDEARTLLGIADA